MLCMALAAVLSGALAATAVARPSSTADGATVTNTVTLITGEKVTVISQAGDQARYVVAQAAAGSYESYQDATGDEYVIPAIAQPYLGTVLGKSLFDVSALVRDGLGSASQLPVSLTYAAGASPTAPAGVTLTSTGVDTASGYLTPSSEAAFGAVLRARIGADVAAGHQPGTSAPIAGLTGISLAADGGGLSAGITPLYALGTLQINVTDESGAPSDDAFVVLGNTDALSKQQTEVPIFDGVGRVEVPAGHYSAIAGFVDFDADGNETASREVVLDDFTVQAGAGTQNVSIAESSANLPVTVKAARPTSQVDLISTVVRGDATGKTFSVSDYAYGAVPVYVNSVPAPQVGTTRLVVFWTAAAVKLSDAYAYDAAFASNQGIPANETYTVRPGQTATVRQQVSSDPAASSTTGYVADGAIDPAGFAVIAFSVFEPMPGTVTHYFGTADGGEYFQTVAAPNQVQYFDSSAVFAAGHQYTEAWGHGPLTAGFGQYTGPQYCAACTSGSTLYLKFSQDNDSTPAHVGVDIAPPTSESLALYQNGTIVYDQPRSLATALDDLPLVPTTYRAVLDDDYTGVTGDSQSLVTDTDLTFKYDPTTDPGSELPADDQCYLGADSFAAGSACQILPILTVNYQVSGLDLTNTSHSPVQRLDLNIGHLSYDGLGSHSPITSATLSVSFDRGATWRRVPLAGGRDGRYLATWLNPRAGSAAATAGPELKVTAADANGDTITQLVSNAYTIGSTR